ncbi:MAG: ImmA/IrrE family metallo-endopeptidase [Armatimonadota bacterium]|nr:ImmA/IrrE family metallo-endopeptidase [Armatimonadota bacterium]
MRRYRHRDGFLRVWFGPQEIDQMAEEALQTAGLLPRLEAPVVDVERFLEGCLGADLDQYAPLPHDVLGATEFRPGVPPLVQVNAALTRAALDDPHPPPGSRGRWRATLAHEAGHILLHRALVEPDPSQTSLFDPPDRLFRCLHREVAFGGGSDWQEVQANRFMAALLMPKSVFVAAVVRAQYTSGPHEV